MQAPLIEIHNATVFRGHSRVFSDFSLTIPQGESVAILGPNGAGKTTLLKLLSRELYPVQNGGVVKLLGKKTWVLQDLRAQVGIVSDDLQHNYRKTVQGLDVVLSGFCGSVGLRGVPHRLTQVALNSARDVMAQLDISSLENVPLAHMSTGQQRRCLLARALVHSPRTLILDEPTAGLDLRAAFGYLDIMRNLSQAHHNLVLVTHHINEIPPEINRVVLLKNGEIFADGNKREMIQPGLLTDLFEVPVGVTQSGGFYLAAPG